MTTLYLYAKISLMKEQDLIGIIKEQTQSIYLGDDCAYLKDLGIVVSQDNFVENIHFRKDWATPFQIGYKAAAVNISDILASGAIPKYLSVGLSLPNPNENFVKELYKGIKAGSYGAEIIGGDITAAQNILISITAIGKTEGRKISSRSNAKEGYVVITNGSFGKSTIGLQELREGITDTPSIRAHLEPNLDIKFSENIACNLKDDYAMIDTSDGLADALFQVAKASNVKIVTKYIEGMFGAEDYNLVAAVPRDSLEYIKNFFIIGDVLPFDGTFLEIDGKKYSDYDELGLYNHFGD